VNHRLGILVLKVTHLLRRYAVNLDEFLSVRSKLGLPLGIKLPSGGGNN